MNGGSYQTLEVVPNDNHYGEPFNQSLGVGPGWGVQREWIPLIHVHRIVQVRNGTLYALVGEAPYSKTWREVSPNAMVAEPAVEGTADDDLG